MRVPRSTRRQGQTTAPISLLPTELLTAILTVVVAVDYAILPLRTAAQLHADRRTLSLVCKGWHAIVDATGAFWALLTIRPRTQLEKLVRQLARSRNADLHVAIALIGDPTYNDLGGSHALPTLLPQLHRLVALDITIRPSAWAPELFHSSGAVLPRLLSLSITNNNAPPAAPVRITAPNLQCLHLDRIVVAEWGLLVGDGLITLSLRRVDIDRPSLLNVLARCHNLQTLQCDEINLLVSSAFNNIATKLSLRHLKRVDFIPGPVSMRFLHSVLPMSQLESLMTAVASYGEEQFTTIFDGTQWTSLTCMNQGAHYEPFCIQSFADDTGVVRTRRFVRGDASDIGTVAFYAPHAFCELVELRLDIIGLLNLSDALAPTSLVHTLAHVERLTLSQGYGLWLRTLQDAMEHLRQTHRKIQLPALRTLRFVHSERPEHPHGYLTPGCIDEFISLLGCRERPEVQLDKVVITNHPNLRETLGRVGTFRRASAGEAVPQRALTVVDLTRL